MTDYAKDTGFTPSGMAGPLIFLFLFILFVYGALFVGLMGISNTLIHRYHLTFFLNRGDFGAFIGVCCLLAAWAALVFALSAGLYFIVKAKASVKTARLTGQVVIFLMFHVFTMPFILWPMIRNSSPKLRARHTAKLRRLAAKRAPEHKSGAARQRETERQAG